MPSITAEEFEKAGVYGVGRLESIQTEQARSSAQARKQDALLKAYREFYEAARLPSGMFCYDPNCAECRAAKKIRQLTGER